MRQTYLCALFFMLALAALLVASPYVYAQRPAVDVIASPVVKQEFADVVEALGTTKANESVIITADRSEKIIKIHFEDGQVVKKGDSLVTLDKGQEEAELRAAQALASERQNAYDRAKGLSGSSALPKATLQQRLAELQQAQATADAIRARLQDYVITAPFDGVLGLRQVSVGSLVQPADTITTIDDLSQIKVDFDVPSALLGALKPGLQVTGTVDAFEGRRFTGQVSSINTQVDPVTRTFTVRALIPNDDDLLKPGLLMHIVLYSNPRDTLLIPEEALLKRGEKSFVFLVTQAGEETFVKQTEVTLGARQPGVIEVLSGLSEGDTIVSHGIIKLRDGAKVNVIAKETKDTPLKDLLEQTPSEDRS